MIPRGDPQPHGPHDTWDVFLSYNSDDWEAVESLAIWLEDEGGLWPFLDRWRLVAGGDSQQDLEEALSRSICCAVCCGPNGLGPWQNGEVRAAIQLLMKRGTLRVIPVFLPQAIAPLEDLPLLLHNRTWCDLRGDEAAYEDGLSLLRSGILNRPPGRATTQLPGWLSVEVGGRALGEPTGVAVAGDHIFVADRRGGRIVKIGASGVVAEATGLDRPHHLVVHDSAVMVCDTYANRIVAFDLDLEGEVWELHEVGSTPLNRPHGLCWDPRDRRLLVLNSDGNRLEGLRLSEQGGPGAPIDASDGVEFSTPCGMGQSPAALFVANTFDHEMVVLDADLAPVYRFGSLGYGDGGFAYPVGVACWHDYVVIADEHNQRLQVWHVTSCEAGWDAKLLTSSAVASHLGSPFGVVFDRFGDLLVTDRKKGRLLRIDFSGLLREYGGSPPL